MTDDKPRLLLTGASGLLGTAVVADWADRWNITALVGRHRLARGVVANEPGDLTRPETLAPVVARVEPAVVLHCGAWTDVDGCEANPNLARTIHRDASAALAAGAARVGASFVYVSTDSLFSGAGLHAENDPIDPRSVYARTKREGEEACLTACDATLVVRTCIIGWNAQPKTSLAEWLLRELRGGRPVKAFADVSFTPILTTTLARAMERLLQQDARGVLHVSGGECVSKLEFARKLATVFELPQVLVEPSAITNLVMRAPRPPSPCLDSRRYSALTGDPLHSVDEELREMRRLEATGWVERARASLAT